MGTQGRMRGSVPTIPPSFLMASFLVENKYILFLLNLQNIIFQSAIYLNFFLHASNKTLDNCWYTYYPTSHHSGRALELFLFLLLFARRSHSDLLPLSSLLLCFLFPAYTSCPIYCSAPCFLAYILLCCWFPSWSAACFTQRLPMLLVAHGWPSLF